MQRWIDEAEAVALAHQQGYSDDEIAANGLGDVLGCEKVDFDNGLYLIEVEQ